MGLPASRVEGRWLPGVQSEADSLNPGSSPVQAQHCRRQVHHRDRDPASESVLVDGTDSVT